MKHIFILFLVFCISIIAKSENLVPLETKKPYSIKFTVKRFDHPLNTLATFSIKEFEFPSIFGIKTNSSISPDLILSDYRKEVIVDLHSECSFISLNYKVGNTPKSAFFRGIHIYRVANGDSLTCSIYGDSVSFKGKGAYRMNLQTRLFKISDKFNTYSSSDTTSSSFENEFKIRDKALSEQMILLNIERKHLDDEFYFFLVNQCVGVRNFSILNYLNIAMHRGTNMAIKAKQFFTFFFSEKNLNLSDVAHNSNYLMDYLYYKEKLEFELLNTEDLLQNRKGSNEILRNITRKYNGKIRERLYLIAFIDLPSTYLNVYDFLDSALLNTHDKAYKNTLVKIKESTERNMQAFNFSLPDSNGHFLKLQDFKNKVVVMDFWFTGCIPCKKMATKMKAVINRFGSKDVVFLTVNVDQDKKKWIASLNTGEYTHPENVNLNTNGKGYNHPILVHYNINRYPTLIIINKLGQMISANPPIPSDPESTENLIKLIESGLLKE